MKRTASIVVFLLALSLTAFASSTPVSAIGMIAAWIPSTPLKPAAVPEPGELLLLGTGMLVGIGWLRRKLGNR